MEYGVGTLSPGERSVKNSKLRVLENSERCLASVPSHRIVVQDWYYSA